VLQTSGFGDGVQTTLLGLAIAIILALVAALVGPIFVDWGQYRTTFEATASRLTGLDVRIRGTIDARLLPTPTLTLQQVEIVRPDAASTLYARSLGLEFALGPLVRGQWRASEMHLDGAEFAVALDGEGRLDWTAPAIGFDPEAISIDRLEIRDGRVVLADASSDTKLTLERFEFRGELRSLAGPVKGEGSVVVAGQQYPYRIAAGRLTPEGAVRARLIVDATDPPLSVDTDATVWVEDGVPRLDGTLQLARPVVRTTDGIIEPWRVSGRIRGDSAAAVLEKIEFQYGRDEQPVKLRGDGKLTLGRAPQLDIGLGSTQVDLDRLLALPEAARGRPLLAIKSLGDFLTGGGRWPIPVKLAISVENVNFAGAMLQRVNGEVRLNGDAKANALNGNAESWDVDLLDFRAPGATQVRLKGRVKMGTKGMAFEGPAKVEARDPRALVAWLTNRTEAQNITATALRAEGDVKFGNEAIAVDRLKAELDRMPLEGRFAYAWASDDRPARVEAALSAPDLDLDRLQALAQAMFGETAFDWPREGTVTLKVERASLAGVEAKRADVNLHFDRQGIEIERLAIGDFGGATLAIKGRFDGSAALPRGKITLNFDARSLDGVIALAEKFAPAQAAELRRRAARLTPARLSASIAVDAEPPRLAGPPAAGGPANATFTIDGTAGVFRIGLQGDADGFGAVSLAELERLLSARMKLAGRLEASDGGALIELLGLDSAVVVDKRPGWLSLSTGGRLDGDLSVDSQLLAGGLDLSAKGTLRLPGKDQLAGAFAVKLASAGLRTPRAASAGRPAETVPVSLTGQLALTDKAVGLTDLAGKIAGTDVSGRLRIGTGAPASIDGELQVGAVNLSAALAAATGTPAPPPGSSAAGAAWPSEPFAQGLFERLAGQIAIRSDRVTLTPRLAARAARGVLRFDGAAVSLTELDGTLAGGQVAGEIAFARSLEGLNARAKLRIANADLLELLPGDGRGPLSGRVALNLDVEGDGRSPIALVGALHGKGTFTLQEGQILRLDPATFAAVIRSVDLGLPVDATRIRDRVESTLNNGRLPIPQAEGEILIAGGQARLNSAVVHTQGAELALSGSVSLAESLLDARAVLKGPEDAGGPAGTRPELTIMLKGPIEQPKRTLEVAALANWLALRTVEQQTRKIDALEAAREVPGLNPYAAAPSSMPPSSATAPAAPAVPAVPPKPRVTTEMQRRAAAAAKRPPAEAPPPERPTLFGIPLDLRPPLPIFRSPAGTSR
jgi:large subunit ribosomal protein L24